MTNEYATKVLKRIQYGTTYPVYEALDMAIEALNFVSEHHQSNIETYAHDMGVSLEQAERELRVEELSCSEEPNRSDTIYRQDAIDALCKAVDAKGEYEGEWLYTDEFCKVVNDLPSAQPEQPERKKGEWIDDGFQEEWWGEQFTCSICDETMIGISNYCPNCGAEMREVIK